MSRGDPSRVEWMWFARPPQCQAKEIVLIVARLKQSRSSTRVSIWTRASIADHADYYGSKCSHVGLSLINVGSCTNTPMSLLHAAAQRREVSTMDDTSQRKSYSPGAVRISSSAPVFQSEPGESLIENCSRNRGVNPVTVRETVRA